MPMYDRLCQEGHKLIDCFEPINYVEIKCPECGSLTKRTWFMSPPSVIGDDIPGGIEIRHGICNEDGSPKRYYSKSEIAKAAKAKGLFPLVEHVTEPGTDKNRHTVKWV